MEKKDIKILVVDDMRMILVFLEQTLDNLGYTNVVCATDGLDAYNKLIGGNFNLLISDWNMPKLTGIELVKKIRQDDKLRELPIIMVTAEADADHVKEAIKEGVNDYVIKPVNADVLENKIKAIIQEVK